MLERAHAATIRVPQRAPGRAAPACQVCAAPALQEIKPFRNLTRVTSDCKPFPKGGRLTVCGSCSAVQKLVTPAWRREIGAIYASYAMHHQSNQADQVVFDRVTNRLRPRAGLLCRHLSNLRTLPNRGTWLDVGAGSGAMLEAASAQFSNWDLFAHDLDRRYDERLRRIVGFRDFFDGDIDAINRRFDVITLVHSLEHFTAPRETLASLRGKLNPGGRLIIQVSDAAVNPFDLVVADHLMHFDAGTLAQMVRGAGYRVEIPVSNWIPKELSLIATVGAAKRRDRSTKLSLLRSAADVKGQVTWLASFVRRAKQLSRRRGIGLFGTAISSTWLAGYLGDRVSFFVDEDPGRIGRRHLGSRVFAPLQVPTGSVVYLGLFPPTAGAIRQRLASTGVDFRMPPALPKPRRRSRSKHHSSRGHRIRSQSA